MSTILLLIRRLRFFLIPYGLFLACAGIFLSFYSKKEIHLFLNKFYSPVWDFLMPWITWIGNGWLITAVIFLLFAWNRRFAFFTGVAVVSASIITYILKQTIYYGEPRPKYVFSGDPEFRIVPGFEQQMHLYDTFPSGHTTGAFALFVCLAIAVHNKWLRLLCFVLAILAGSSRIYLSQHFLPDVYGGSLIGTLVPLLIIGAAIHKGWLPVTSDPTKAWHLEK
ncbi:MAG TPA: phosphatase PAP2 family protein [Bacteroidia bacterium]|nr:phosphatase PAP2 family protein [Bacteroidia bacterium]